MEDVKPIEKRVYEINHPHFESLARELLGRGNSLCFRATGRSMMPFIRGGDQVVLDPIAKIPHLGDVILGRPPAGRLVLHRVVARRSQEIITRGDANGQDDEPIPLEYIFGVVSAIPGRGSNLHLKFPFRLLLAKKSTLSRILRCLPGRTLLKQILMPFLL